MKTQTPNRKQELEMNLDPGLEQDGKVDPQPEPQVKEFCSLIPEVRAGGIDESARSVGTQART